MDVNFDPKKQPNHSTKQILSAEAFAQGKEMFICRMRNNGKITKTLVTIKSQFISTSQGGRKRVLACRERINKNFVLYLDLYAVEPDLGGLYVQGTWLEEA